MTGEQCLVMLFHGFLICLGIFMLTSPDAYWTWQKWGNSLEGVQSERTNAWETKRVVGGVLLILLPLVSACYLLTNLGSMP